jgi:hypothetical protein
VIRTKMARREWLAVFFPLATGTVLIAAGALDAASTPNGWLAFVTALVAGVVAPVVYTLILAREGRLYLRDSAAIERSRDRISRISIPIGWLLAGAMLAASAVLAGLSSVVVATAPGGAALGIWPGILANFIRLRREVWTQ